MKKRRLPLILLPITLVSFAAFILSGCYVSKVISLERTWHIDFEYSYIQSNNYDDNVSSDDPDVDKINVMKLAFEYITVTLDPKNRRASIDYELGDCVSETDLPLGTFDAYYRFEGNSCYVYDASGTRYYFSVSDTYYDYAPDKLVKIMYANCNITFNRDVGKLKANTECTAYLEFIAEGYERPNKPSEENPDREPSNSEIKTAYENAGYTTDLSEDNVDPSVATLITTMKNSYAALGADMCFIGKNLDEPTSIELYMLISAADKSVIDDVENALSGSYAYPLARKNKCIIVYISVVGTPNFAPFENA